MFYAALDSIMYSFAFVVFHLRHLVTFLELLINFENIILKEFFKINTKKKQMFAYLKRYVSLCFTKLSYYAIFIL